MNFSDEGRLLLGCLLCVAVLFILLFIVGRNAIQVKNQFMVECEQDKKHYECQAMWRAGDKR